MRAKEIDAQKLGYIAGGFSAILRLADAFLAAIEMMVMQAFFSSRRMIAPTVAGFVFSAVSAAATAVYFGVNYVQSTMGVLSGADLASRGLLARAEVAGAGGPAENERAGAAVA